MDVTFGGLGDLPDDVCGKIAGKGSSVDSRDVIDGGCSDLSKVWADRREGRLELIANSGPMADRPSVPQKNDLDSQKIIREARKLLMKGGGTDQLNQFLSLAFDGRPVPDDPQIRALHQEAGLLGNVYLDRRVFASCDELKSFRKSHKNHYADLLFASDACKGCSLCADRCPLTGLRVVEKIDYTPELLSGLRSKLAMAGKCSADTPIETKERLREIFLSKPTPLHQRGVAASITTQKSFDQDEVSRKLAIEAKRREKERSKDARALETATELRPMLRCLHELLLTGSDLLTVRKSFEQRGFAQKSIEKYNTELRSLLSDSLVRSGLKVLPSLYDRCGDCKEFLARRQSLRPKLAARFEKCQGCNHNSDGVGCRLMSCSFINPGEVPPLEVRKIALYNLKEKQLISSTESSKSELIEQFRPLEGLKKAFQLVDSRRSIAPVRTAAVSGQRPEMQFKRLKTTGLDAVGDDAARYSRAEIDADELHHCMVKRYPVNPSATKIIRSGKCMGCDFGKDGMRCAAQGVPFADEMKVSDDISEANKEGREIRSYFAGTEIKVEIDKKPLKKMLEIEVENAGKNLVVDSGRRSADPAPDILLSMQGAEMPVEIDPPRTYAPPLVIGGLNAGFNIDV